MRIFVLIILLVPWNAENIPLGLSCLVATRRRSCELWRGKSVFTLMSFAVINKKSRATFSGNPAVLVVEDPWLSVPRLLGVWL